MIRERKQFFVGALKAHYREIIGGARLAETRAAEAAAEIQNDARRREDAKGSVEFGRMAAGHRARRVSRSPGRRLVAAVERRSRGREPRALAVALLPRWQRPLRARPALGRPVAVRRSSRPSPPLLLYIGVIYKSPGPG